MDDHTASGSLMMAVNGATTPDEIVWSQTINNIPANTDCIFSVWVATICAGNEANIYFRINDNVIGNLNASTVVGEWNQFFAVWNSGNTTSATIKLTNQNTMGGGNDFALDDIYFAPITCPPLNNNGPLCEGETLMLEAESHIGATYHWSGPQNFSSTQQNPTRPNVTTAMAGTYTCYITVPSPYNPSIVGTSSTESTAVTINSTPSADFTFTTVCEGSPTQFHSDDDNPQQTIYNWNFGDGNTSTSQNPTHTYANAGTYTVKLTTNISSCGNEETKQVTVNTSPTANAGQDQTIEYGGTATLSGSGGNGTFTYSWEPADKVVNPNAQTTTTRELTQPTTFTLTVTSTTSSDCTDQDQVTINIDGSAMTTSINADDTEICQGESTTLHAMASGGTSNYTYTWIPTTGLSNPNIPNPVASPDVTTEYTCTISDGQTQQTPEITITVHPTPNANATADETTIGLIETTTLRGSGGSTGASYHWEPADKVVNADEQTTETEPLETTTAFTLFITNPSGCIDSTEIIIMVEGSSMTATVSADDTEICQGESTTLHAMASGGTSNYTYTWIPTTGLSNPNIPNPVASPDVTTEYTCTISDGQTQQTPEITITVHPTPNANATADETTIGLIETTTLRGSGGSTGASYHWEPADKVVNADEQTTETEPLETTTAFTLFITNPSGCIDSTEIIIMVEGSSMTATVSADDTEICQGESTTLKAEPLGGSGLYSYEWTDDNGESLSTDQTTTVSPDKTTTYTCTIDDRMTQIEKSITITVNEWIETSIDTIACGSFTIEEQGQVYTNSDPVPDTINSNLYTENEYGCFMTNLKLVLYSSSQISPITGITPPLFFTGTGYDIFEYSIKEVSGGGAELGIISYK